MKNPPPFLISAALLFWGWQTHLLPLAILFTVVVEVRRILKTKWDLSRTEWSHLTDICTIILLSILTYGFFHDKTRIMYDISKLLPVVFFPLFAAQLYSISGKVDLAALSLIARKQKKASSRFPPLNIAYPYLLICLIAAGFGNRTDGAYFIGICALSAWAAYGFRSQQTTLARWILLLLLIAGIGFTAHSGLFQLQRVLTDVANRFFEHSTNPLKSVTSLGDIGTQKLSDTILFRATPGAPPDQPLLLREASYNYYRTPSWYASKIELSERPPTIAKFPIHLTAPPKNIIPKTIHIHTRIRKRKDTLKLPGDTFQIEYLPKATLKTNRLGSIVISDVEKGLIDYRASFAAGASADGPPDEFDLNIPPQELKAIQQFIAEHRLDSLPPEQLIQTLESIFDTEYSYTLDHKGKGARKTPLAYFLLDRKAGHCEYFATATVLILRACDIPARYIVGYAAAEYSALEKQFIIRKRHGHAWTRVHLNGRWQDLDTTSPNWLALENKNASPFRFLTDFVSFLSFKLSQFRWSEKDYMGRIAIALLLLLILMISNRLRKQKKSGRKKTSARRKRRRRTRAESPDSFDRLEKVLTQKGYPRNPGETLLTWARRIQQANPDLLDYDDLHCIIAHHYRQRFAPGHTPELTAIQAAVKQLLESINE